MLKSLTLLLLACVVVTVDFAWSAEVCCPEVGCFQTDGPFKHLPKPSCAEKIGIKVGMFTRQNRNYPLDFGRVSSGTDVPQTFQARRRTIFVVHGYMNEFETEYMQGIKDDILEAEDANVVLVCWKYGAGSMWYPNSAANTRVVGAEVALLIDRLKKEGGMYADKTWCIGFSLGAHTCGFAGYRTQIQRITGLDPAGPKFDKYGDEARLTKSAAKFVDVIHTDGGGVAAYYGLLTPAGHMDFYPNAGRNQPGCWTDIEPGVEFHGARGRFFHRGPGYSSETPYGSWSMSCSHGRAYEYFRESIRNKGCHNAIMMCSDPYNIPRSCTECLGGKCAEMGYRADQGGWGGGAKFYLETKSKPEFCLYQNP